MKKLLIVFFTITLFSVKASFAQFYQVDAGFTLDTNNSYEEVTDSNFAWQFVPSDDGYILQAWFFGSAPSHPTYVSWGFVDKNDNTNWGDNSNFQDFPGFSWGDYKYVQLEWSSYDDYGYYDDVDYVFTN